MKYNRIIPKLSAGLVLIFVMAACSISQQPVVITEPQEVTTELQEVTPAIIVPVTGETPAFIPPTETLRPTVAHLTLPGEPPGGWLSEITDRDTSLVAVEKRALGGENFSVNLFERPFNADTMDKYFPDLDITRARLSYDTQWVFVTIRLSGLGDGGTLGGNYGVEVDLDVDGRGDFLVFAAAPGVSWSAEGVRVWVDVNNDVGSSQPIYGNAPLTGDGYETLSFESGYGTDPDLAWARLDPGDPSSVQIAFKTGLLNADYKFTWGAWADRSLLNPAWYDYNDHFTLAQAGSPLTESADYPVKALYELDNTCRWVVGFTPSGSELGICPVPATPTPMLPGSIGGGVYYDVNMNNIFDAPPDFPISGATIRIRSGNCGSPGAVVGTGLTEASGLFDAISVPAGTYCVDVSPDPDIPGGWTGKSPAVTVTVTNGGSVYAYFWYWYLLLR